MSAPLAPGADGPSGSPIATETVPTTRVHLSDTEFRGEIIYFLVLDRFHAGCQTNLGERSELNDPARKNWNKYWGGDLQGLLDKLDYLQELGVTAIWTTPLFEQVEALEVGRDRAPIHGYWTKDFKRINARWVNDPASVRLFERENTVFDRLIRELHRRGMKFILDIVCNHSSPQTDQGKGRIYDDGRLLADFEDDRDHWYHHYGVVTNWQDQWQIQNCELEGLATFNENNLEYRRYISAAIKLWLDKGVDALRVDTVKHMPIWFWQEFTSNLQSHKPDVFIFGEWIFNHPLIPESVLFANQGGMSLLDFGLNTAIRECLGQGSPGGFQLVQAVLDEDHRYRGATELVTFFENHDMPRFQSLQSAPEYLHLALVLLLTSRGIPCLYYGCEQYLHNDTAGGQDPYNRPMMDGWDTTNEAFRLIRLLNAERKRNPALQWGGHWPLVVEAETYCYVRRYRGSFCLVVLNRGADRILTVDQTGLSDGILTCLLAGRKIQMLEGTFTVALAHGEALVCAAAEPAATGLSVVHVQINGAPMAPGDRLAVIGDCPELGGWDLGKACYLECINSNTWFGEIIFDATRGHSLAYKYVILSPHDQTAPHRELRTTRRRSVASHGLVKWRDIWEQ